MCLGRGGTHSPLNSVSSSLLICDVCLICIYMCVLYFCQEKNGCLCVYHCDTRQNYLNVIMGLRQLNLIR